MKKTVLCLSILSALSFGSFSAVAQTDCSGGRYETILFPNVTVTSNVVYGNSINVNGQSEDLLMDIYTPDGDTETNRPLVILAHGGSFISGSKTDDGSVVTLCEELAKRGYVAVSMNYRLESPLNIALSSDREKTFLEIVYRAVQDQKACIRFFRQSVTNGNPYGINPNQIIVGGSSAGAVLSLHTAFLNKPSELPSKIDTAALGDLEGNSGNPGFDSRPQAVINLCGAVGDTSWMEIGDVPFVSMHGDQDNTVPFDADTARPLGVPITLVYGSSVMKPRADNLGIDNPFYHFVNAGHVPYQNDAAYMDTTINFVVDFLHDQLCNKALSTPDAEQISFSVYPNPTAGELVINAGTLTGEAQLQVVNLNGQVVFTAQQVLSGNWNLQLPELRSGIYMVKLQHGKGVQTQKIVVQ